MSYYPPPPPDNDGHNYQQHPQQPLHHQEASNRENIGWNNLPDYNMSSKYNSYAQNDMHNNYYNNNGPPNSQRHDNYHHRGDDGDGGNNRNNTNPTIIKRAAKRRVKHDLPGPAGNWFRQKKQQKSAAAAAAVKNRKSISSSALKSNDSGGTIMTVMDNGEQKSTVDSKDIITTSSSSPSSIAKTKPQDEQLFHDHSSDLHECNAWNFMCTTLNRIVPPANLVLQNHTTTTNSAGAHTTYKSILRNSIPDNYALLHEIHEGKYDTCHLDKELYSTDLHVPLLVGYVASVQCHAHSDWTALLVDEMHSVAKYTTNGSGNNNGSHNNNVGRGVVCWIEERLVKQHANWIRPGVVWLIEGAKLALFSSLDDDDDDEGHHSTTNNTNGSSDAEMSTTTVDLSPSTDNSRGGGAIDRMILVGESSMVYAWTPEEASSMFTHQEFSDLMERRCDLGLRGGEEELRDEDKEVVEKKDVIKCVDDGMTSTSNIRTSKGGSDDIDDGDNEALIEENTNVETVEIIDVDNVPAEKAPEVAEQVLEACSAANNNTTHMESRKECEERLPQVVDSEPTDSTRPPVKNLSNPYAKKNLSQVTPHEENATKSTDTRDVSKQDSVKESSVLVQPKASSVSPVKDAKVQDQMTEKRGLAVEDTQKPQTQRNDTRTDQQIHVDMDNSFDDMLDEDSLDEMPAHNEEGRPENKTEETKSNKNDSFDDMLDEDSLDVTPHKAKDVVGGKLDSKSNTPGADSFDDMLDEDSLDVTPLGLKTSTTGPGGDSFDDMLDDDSDDNIEAMFLTTNPQTTPGNLFSPSQGASILDKDDLADLGDEEDDDF